MKRSNKKTSTKYNKNKGLKPPYFENDNYNFQEVKKQMKTDFNEPTIETFSEIDETDSKKVSNSVERIKETRKRPTKEKKKSKFAEYKIEIISGIVISILFYFLYTQSNWLTRHDVQIENTINSVNEANKNIEIIKSDVKNVQIDVKVIDTKIDHINKKIEKK